MTVAAIAAFAVPMRVVITSTSASRSWAAQRNAQAKSVEAMDAAASVETARAMRVATTMTCA
jgi:predicted secreted protein